VGFFFGSGAAALAFGVALLVAVFAVMFATLDDERGGEGGRPVEGAMCEDSGSERFSRGFLNIGEGVSHRRVS